MLHVHTQQKAESHVYLRVANDVMPLAIPVAALWTGHVFDQIHQQPSLQWLHSSSTDGLFIVPIVNPVLF